MAASESADYDETETDAEGDAAFEEIKRQGGWRARASRDVTGRASGRRPVFEDLISVSNA